MSASEATPAVDQTVDQTDDETTATAVDAAGQPDDLTGATTVKRGGTNRAATNRAATNRAATIYDIAQLAGVNPSTVSRALSRPGRINEKTAQKIHDAAKQLNYVANPAARALPTGRTGTLGLIVADITNPMFFDVVRGAEREAAERNYTLVLAEFHESAEMELVTARRLMPSVDGLILATSRLLPDDVRMLGDEKPVVVINRQVDDVESIVADIDPGLTEALDHLAELGHRRLAFVSGPARSWMSRHRWDRIRALCVERGIETVRVPSSRPDMAAGREAATAVLDTGATVVLAYNDLLAIGIMLELRHRGIDVPERLSIVGFDDIFGSDFTTPALTSIRSPHLASGSYAVQTLFAKLGSTDVPTIADLATTLIMRESTAPPFAGA